MGRVNKWLTFIKHRRDRRQGERNRTLHQMKLSSNQVSRSVTLAPNITSELLITSEIVEHRAIFREYSTVYNFCVYLRN